MTDPPTTWCPLLGISLTQISKVSSEKVHKSLLREFPQWQTPHKESLHVPACPCLNLGLSFTCKIDATMGNFTQQNCISSKFMVQEECYSFHFLRENSKHVFCQSFLNTPHFLLVQQNKKTVQVHNTQKEMSLLNGRFKWKAKTECSFTKNPKSMQRTGNARNLRVSVIQRLQLEKRLWIYAAEGIMPSWLLLKWC